MNEVIPPEPPHRSWHEVPWMRGPADDKVAMVIGYTLFIGAMFFSFLVAWFIVNIAWINFAIAFALCVVWGEFLHMSQVADSEPTKSVLTFRKED